MGEHVDFCFILFYRSDSLRKLFRSKWETQRSLTLHYLSTRISDLLQIRKKEVKLLVLTVYVSAQIHMVDPIIFGMDM